MNLKCYVKGKEYNLVQGVTVVEEYNETLDSGSIIIDQIEKIDDLQPYDDVFVYDGDFKGYSNSDKKIQSFFYRTLYDNSKIRFIYSEIYNILKNEDIISQKIDFVFSVIGESSDNFRTYSAYFSLENNKIIMTIPEFNNKRFILAVDEINDYAYLDYSADFNVAYFGSINIVCKQESIEMPKYYKHFLVYQYTEERLNPVKNVYKYVIELCSETKKLETIQLPNVSVTQPLNIDLKKSVFDYIKQFLDLYNPKVKTATGNRTWIYQDKYTLDDSLRDIYKDVYCPDFSLDNPSLRDVLSQLFLVKDRIPYVKDDKIYAMDITARIGDFSTKNVTSIKGSRSYENHADNLKRTYSDALSGKNTARRIEYLGFRNSENALMTLSNMRVETQFPIYKINKIYMCYYKKAHIYKDVIVDGISTPTKTRDMVFLCRQDITPLVKIEQERQVLSQDWNNFNDEKPAGSNCIEEMAQYKLCTVGYSIGSNIISGWGTEYKYPKGWWDITATYIENIFNVIDINKPFGIYTYGYVAENLGEGEYISVDVNENPLDNLITPFTGSARLKSFFFIVDYEGFYNGTVITSKDVDRDDISINDNSSSSLTLLEKDGLFQKEKANRFGNMAYTIEAIYDSLDEVQELGSVYDDDIIIYHREISIFSKFVKVLYYGTKDYVLKNYYTSVYAKHRPYALMDYGQSVKRAENRKMYVLISKEKLYYEDRLETEQTTPLEFKNFGEENGSFSYLDDIMSFATPSNKLTSIDRFEFPKKINYGFMKHQNDIYACDMNTFINGYSLCFNLSMSDNISAGNYIKEANPEMNLLAPEDDRTGSVQDFYSVVDSLETGFTEKMEFWATHISQSENFDDVVFEYRSGIENTLYDKLFALPKLINVSEEENKIGGEYKICKDNKEVIDMTFQIEAYTNDKNVLFSEWMLKLSDLNGIYNKVEEDYEVTDTSGYQLSCDIYYGTAVNAPASTVYYYIPVFILKIPVTIFNNLFVGQKINAYHTWNTSRWPGTPDYWFRWEKVAYTCNMQEIVYVSDDKIGIKCYVQITYRHGLMGGSSIEEKTVTLYFSRFNTLGDLDVSSDETNYYFTDIRVSGALNVVTVLETSNVDVGWFTDENDYSPYDTDLDESDMLKDGLLISDIAGETKTYYKNMFVKFSNEEIKKTLVYDEFKEGEISFSNLKISDVIEEIIEENSNIIAHDFVNKIRIKLNDAPATTQSVQFWYMEEMNGSSNILHFVFGVNITESDIEKGYVDVYLSSISRKDSRVFGNNHLLVGNVTNYVDDNNEENYGERQYYVVK